MARGRKGLGVQPLAGSIRLRFTLATGERVSETLDWPPTPPNVKRAERLAADLRRDIAAGAMTDERYRAYFPGSRRLARAVGARTLGEFCELYLAAIADKSKNTRGQYRNALAWWQKELGTETPIAEIRHSKLAALWGSTPWASWRLANNYLIPLRGVFALAGGDGLLKGDPLEGITNKRRPPGADEPDPFTPAEQEAILRHLEQAPPDVYDYFAFAFGTGMRPEEMIELRRTDMDWASGIARVRRVKSAGEVRPPKNGRFRDVELTRLARAAAERREAYAALVGAADDAPLFLNPVTRRAWNSTASQRDHYWNPALKALGLRHRPAYNTRHTRATRMLMAGCKPAWCANQLGHSVTMFLKVYAKWLPDAAVRGEELAKEESSIRSDFGAADQGSAENANKINEELGRRDWTRTISGEE
jgi:integrase